MSVFVSVCVCVCVCILWDWLLSSWVYGFMRGAWYGTTYHLIGHHNNDIAAIGRRLRITGCLGVSKWVDTGMGVFLCECQEDGKRCTYVMRFVHM